MQISIQVTGLTELRSQLGAQAKQATYAAKKALDTTAYAINGRLKKEMASTFQGGATKYTLAAFNVKQATKANLTAEVNLRTDTPRGGGTSYTSLAHLFIGGRRKYKRLEGWLRGRGLLPAGLSVVPGPGMSLDGLGNMRTKSLDEMLGIIGNQLKNLRAYRKTGKGKAQKAVGYFVILPGDKSRKHPGIYKRIESGISSKIIPMILYVGPGSYRKFIDLDKIGKEEAAKVFPPAFDKELAAALASAK